MQSIQEDAGAAATDPGSAVRNGCHEASVMVPIAIVALAAGYGRKPAPRCANVGGVRCTTVAPHTRPCPARQIVVLGFRPKKTGPDSGEQQVCTVTRLAAAQ